jgi:spermidine/putrescine transport system permease protein
MNHPFYFFVEKAFSNKGKPKAENARHAKKAWRNRTNVFNISNIILILTLLFLFIPLFVIIVYSFNESKGAEFTRPS